MSVVFVVCGTCVDVVVFCSCGAAVALIVWLLSVVCLCVRDSVCVVGLLSLPFLFVMCVV